MKEKLIKELNNLGFKFSQRYDYSDYYVCENDLEQKDIKKTYLKIFIFDNMIVHVYEYSVNSDDVTISEKIEEDFELACFVKKLKNLAQEKNTMSIKKENSFEQFIRANKPWYLTDEEK